MLRWFLLKKKILLLKIWKVAWTIYRSGGNLSKYPPFVQDFEQAFAKYIGSKFGMSFCNGSSALDAALFAVGVGPGDEVLVSSCTVHSDAASIISLGAQPVYVDLDPKTLTFDPEEIDRKLTKKTRCLLVVHQWGNPADLDTIKEKAALYNLKVIEDCSHAHGATWNGQKVGSIGDIGCFSLQGYKAISAAEGGITVTDNEELHHRLTLYGHFGRNPKAVGKTIYKELLPTGIHTKRRANPLGICLAAVDLKYIDKKNKYLKNLIEKIDLLIAEMESLEQIETLSLARKGGYFPGHPVLVKQGHDKEQVLTQLKKRLRTIPFVGTPKFFTLPPIHYHQMKHMNDLRYREQLIRGDSLAGKAETTTISLPQLVHTESILERVIIIPIG